MKAFMDRDFLLSTETAKHLYHDFAAPQPIIDYHCHLSPQEIFEDRQFENITQVWLGGDHYKWRLMRSAGVEERFITGDATDREKFQKWAETVGLAVGNPLYHWSHLELRNYFGYEGVLNGDTAETVWQLCNEKLRSPEMSARKLIVNSNVKALCTTDDPADTLEWHKKIAEDESFGVKVLPSYRPDKALGIEKPEYLEYLARLGEIKSFAQLAEVLKSAWPSLSKTAAGSPTTAWRLCPMPRRRRMRSRPSSGSASRARSPRRLNRSSSRPLCCSSWAASTAAWAW